MNKLILDVDIDTALIEGNIGALSIYAANGAETYAFEYNRDWLNNKNSFAIDPSLPLYAGLQYPPAKALWGVFQDISPDRWGRILQDRAQNGYLSPSDYMLGVSDYMRLGGIRLKEQNTDTYLALHNNIPTLADIRALEHAIMKFENDEITTEDLKILVEPGSSIGGARPKAVITDNGKLYIAKFPSRYDDAHKVINWEASILEISKLAGIDTTNFKLINKDGEKPVLLIERFDRMGGRIHFASAKTMLDSSAEPDKKEHSYLELADIITQLSAAPAEDNHELWKRMTFNALVCNTDDHMRNHGFLLGANGWHLSPAYDINPDRFGYDIVHASLFDDKTRKPSLDLCLNLGEYFGLDEQAMTEDIKVIVKAILQYDRIAPKYGLAVHEIKKMEHVFRHRDIEKASKI